MTNPMLLEECFNRYMNNITEWLPDGIVDINLEILQELHLLNFHKVQPNDSMLTRYFHVVESTNKLTLVNEHFIVWIVPEKTELSTLTYILIALNKEDNIRLELAFSTRGIYNHSHLVLRVLEKYLSEIQNTEEELAKMENKKN